MSEISSVPTSHVGYYPLAGGKYQENGDTLSDFVNLVCQESQGPDDHGPDESGQDPVGDDGRSVSGDPDDRDMHHLHQHHHYGHHQSHHHHHHYSPNTSVPMPMVINYPTHTVDQVIGGDSTVNFGSFFPSLVATIADGAYGSSCADH